jgi:hypothetical protein
MHTTGPTSEEGHLLQRLPVQVEDDPGAQAGGQAGDDVRLVSVDLTGDDVRVVLLDLVR